MSDGRPRALLTDCPAPGVYESIFDALDASSRPLIGPATMRLLVLPIHDDAGSVIGGLWGVTQYEWLHVQLLFVPEALRGAGVGMALMLLAEQEARARGCRGALVETFSFQAGDFYTKLGFTIFGELNDFPPGHSRILLQKRFGPAASG